MLRTAGRARPAEPLGTPRYGVLSMVLVAILCAVIGLTLLALAAAWLLGALPGRGDAALPASAVEARERAADTAADFWDWLRLGR